jgi:glycerol-3-phosphate acyltransferase PlsY
MEANMAALLWTVLGFVLGAMPFSYWLGRLILQTDIRHYGDGNPGAINAWRAGGWRVGVPAMLLDYLKAAVPTGVAHYVFLVSGWGLLGVALAPVLGHAFSPFLGFRGGKALSTTFGVWTGLTLWEGPTLLGGFLSLFYLLQKEDAWSAILGMLAFLVYLIVQQSDYVILSIWTGNTLILTWKHRHALRCMPWPRPWISNIVKGRRQ